MQRAMELAKQSIVHTKGYGIGETIPGKCILETPLSERVLGVIFKDNRCILAQFRYKTSINQCFNCSAQRSQFQNGKELTILWPRNLARTAKLSKNMFT